MFTSQTKIEQMVLVRIGGDLPLCDRWRPLLGFVQLAPILVFE